MSSADEVLTSAADFIHRMTSVERVEFEAHPAMKALLVASLSFEEAVEACARVALAFTEVPPHVD